MVGREFFDRGGDIVDHRVVDFARHHGAAVALGKSNDTDRQRRPADDVGLRRPAATTVRPAKPHQLGRSAANVEQDDACRGRIEQLRAAGRRQPCLGRRIDDLQLEAGFSATRARNASPFSAARQASVAISRARLTLRARILSRQTSNAATARSIAASLMRREAATPSPRRMMRENASMTRNPSAVGRAISRRQLLVPRSSAA